MLTIMINHIKSTLSRAQLHHFLSSGLVLLLFSGNLFAGNANLAWNASTSSNVGGYKVSYGLTAGNYTSTIDVGNTTTYVVPGLQEGTKYFFAVKAYDTTKTIDSAYSNETSLIVSVTVSTALTSDFTTSKTTEAESLAATGSSGSLTTAKEDLITMTTPATVSETIQFGLVAAYGFDEISGTTVVDASGNANHGTISNAIRISTGHSGNALQFNGTNAWVTVNNSASLALSTGMTLEAWVYPQSTSAKTVILKECSGSEVYSLYANEEANLPVSYINDGSYRSVSGSNQLPLNQWTHLVATYDGQYQRLYLNGLEVATSLQSGLIQQSIGVLRIGGNSLWGEYFQGYIDEVRIYNRALTAMEVMYNKATAINASSNIGLVAAYGFEEISGTAVVDASGEGNHGTISNAVRITAGHSGNALQFKGTNAWVTVKNSVSLALSTGMTLEAWVYPQSIRGQTVIMKETPGSEVYSLYASEDANIPVSYINNGSYRSVSGSKQLPLNQWTHLVATYDGQHQRLYLNGLEVAKSLQDGLIQQSTGVLRIGGNSLWGEYFKGYIDEVRIYNRALTALEVMYNKATAISVTNPQQFVMGDNIKEPWVDYRSPGIAEAFQTVPRKSGVVTNVAVYLGASSTASELVAGIYKNNNGHPGDLITQGRLNKPKPGAWNQVTIPVVTVTAGQPYWIAIMSSKGQIGFLDQVGSGTGSMETSAFMRLSFLPGKWKGSAYRPNSAMSIFGNGYWSYH